MSTPAFTIVEADSNNELSNVISEYVVNEAHASDKWGTMVNYAHAGNYNAEEWKVEYERAEEDQAHLRELAGETIQRTKAGKVIASKAFPKTWNTDKAIIGKALKEDVGLHDEDGKPKGKTAIQAEYREAVAEYREEKPAYEKIATVINAYEALFDKLESTEKVIIRDMVESFHRSQGL